jgi:hypothetical protein
MFNNNVTLVKSAGESEVNYVNVNLIDGPTNQKTLRRMIGTAGKYDFSIGHQASNENPGFTTQRSVIRLSLTKVDTETDQDFTVYAQVILSVPTEKTPAADVADLLARLFSFFITEGDSENLNALGDGMDYKSLMTAVATRLVGGEP